MKIKFRRPVSFAVHPQSPAVDGKREAIRIKATHVSFDGQTVEVDLYTAFLFPSDVADRYKDFLEALVIVVHDIEQADGASIRAENAFIIPSPDDPGGASQTLEPTLPMPGRGSHSASTFRGGAMNAYLTFPCAVAVPRYRPSVYIYLVFENYVSNVLGLDLVEKKVVEFESAGSP